MVTARYHHNGGAKAYLAMVSRGGRISTQRALNVNLYNKSDTLRLPLRPPKGSLCPVFLR